MVLRAERNRRFDGACLAVDGACLAVDGACLAVDGASASRLDSSPCRGGAEGGRAGRLQSPTGGSLAYLSRQQEYLNGAHYSSA
jgi:hypothetical protein